MNTALRLGTVGAYEAAPSGPASGTVTVPASGIPVGVTLIVLGWTGWGGNPVVSDPRGNRYTRRSPVGSQIFVVDAQITTALVSGDLITVSIGSGNPAWGFVACWYSQCFFDTMTTPPVSAQGNVTTTTADGGPITTAPGGGPVFGVFGLAAQSGTFNSPMPTISTPGAGYTNETGAATNDYGGSQSGVAIRWESKNGAGGVVERATATINLTLGYLATGNSYFATVAYAAPGPLGVVNLDSLDERQPAKTGLCQIKRGGAGVGQLAPPAVGNPLTDGLGANLAISITPANRGYWIISAEMIWVNPAAAWSENVWSVRLNRADMAGWAGPDYTYVCIHSALGWQTSVCDCAYRLDAGIAYTATLYAEQNQGLQYWGGPDYTSISGEFIAEGSLA